MLRSTEAEVLSRSAPNDEVLPHASVIIVGIRSKTASFVPSGAGWHVLSRRDDDEAPFWDCSPQGPKFDFYAKHITFHLAPGERNDSIGGNAELERSLQGMDVVPAAK